MRRFLAILCLFAVACEPIANQKDLQKKDALTQSENTGGNVEDNSNSGTNSTDTSASSDAIAATEIFFNLTSALRVQYLNQVKSVFSSLYIMVDGSKCSLSETPVITLPGEIADSEFDRIFASIQSKINNCLGIEFGDEGEIVADLDRVKIKGLDLYTFERDLEKLLGDDVVKACTKNSDCARLPHGGYFRSGLGFLYSKKIQGIESVTAQQKIRDLMIYLANSEITDMTDFTVAVEDIPDPIPVPRCIKNVCKSVTP